MLVGKERHDLGRPHDLGYPVRALRTRKYRAGRNGPICASPTLSKLMPLNDCYKRKTVLVPVN